MRTLTLLACAAALISAPAESAAADSDPPAARRALVLCGHPGDAPRREQYAETVTKLSRALVENLAFDERHLTVLFGTEDMHRDGGPVPQPAAGACTREAVAAAVENLRGALRPDDALWVFVIGHSYFDGRWSWFNLPGRDLHQESFAALFQGLACRELVFWITTPASGFYIRPLSGEGRVVITATEADREINETLFPHVLAGVLSEPPDDFDLDGDGRRTLLDLYLAVARGVAQAYADENALPTEHAQLEDNGDGRGSEVQADYLPAELGGRGTPPPTSRAETLDGARSARIVIPLRPAEREDQPSDAESPR